MTRFSVRVFDQSGTPACSSWQMILDGKLAGTLDAGASCLEML